MNTTTDQAHSQEELQSIYAARFSGLEEYRLQVWQILISQFFSRWIRPEHHVLDLGCGYGEFINTVSAARKFAMDLNPATKKRLKSDIQLFSQDCSQPWPLSDGCLDVVFTSNFFEHLPNKQLLQATLAEAFRCLKPGGRLIALGPNIKFLPGQYWDFFDHYIELTELSLAEVMTMTSYQMEEVIPKFLPYSMSQGSRPPLWTLKLFLKLPLAWKIFGRQFLVVGRKGQ
jgi:SAM-dependent methyltransferase